MVAGGVRSGHKLVIRVGAGVDSGSLMDQLTSRLASALWPYGLRAWSRVSEPRGGDPTVEPPPRAWVLLSTDLWPW